MVIDFFALDRFPDNLDEDVVAPAPKTVHADGDASFFSHPVKASLVNCES